MPNLCIGCENVTEEANSLLCNSCYEKLEPYKEIHPWQKEMIDEGIINNSLSAFWFRENTPIQNIIHELKYKHIKRAGIFLGTEIGKRILETGISNFDYIIPVPLHKSKKRERMYNQCEFIAKGISGIIKAEVLLDAVRRIRFTQSQTKLNKTQRKENVKGVFSVNEKYKNKIKNRNILVADDVITTGATILELAKTLRAAQCKELWVCSAAYAELKNQIIIT